jgi:hypothetical protein
MSKKNEVKRSSVKDGKSKRITKNQEPERLKITGVADWEDAVGAAMLKKRPPEGWPK